MKGLSGNTEHVIREARDRAELLDAVLYGLSEGVLATDLEGRVLFANPAARAMLGMDPERIESLDEPWELPDPFEGFDLRKAVARCAQAGECPEAVANKDGSPLRVRLRRLERFDEHNGGVLVIVRELSDAGRLEARQQRFLAVAAHELKTPITAIIGIADLLQDEEKPGVRRRFLRHLGREAQRVRDLSETLLRMARTGCDQREPVLEPTRLLEAARAAATRVEPLVLRARLRLRVEGEDGRVLADRGWLEQILLALLDNAIKYSEPGGVVTVRAGGNSLAVEDEGVGISERDLPHVFEPLYRGGCGVGREGSQGAGLGVRGKPRTRGEDGGSRLRWVAKRRHEGNDKAARDRLVTRGRPEDHPASCRYASRCSERATAAEMWER
jgi:signal transduction histidine kinase